ncbi:MAG: hypothetical protein ABSH48_17550 [Verrucomicrobiota bacterium]|jgi:hypothetical protein
MTFYSCSQGVRPLDLHVHPYTVGLTLGRQISFSAPREQITAELEKATRKQIG